MLLKTRIGEGLHKESVTDFPRRQTRQNVNIVNLRATLNIVKLMLISILLSRKLGSSALSLPEMLFRTWGGR